MLLCTLDNVIQRANYLSVYEVRYYISKMNYIIALDGIIQRVHRKLL